MTFTVIAPSEVDFKSPLDETLMDKIRANFDDHEARLGASGGAGTIAFKVNGTLTRLKALLQNDLKFGRQLDGALVTEGQTFTRARLFLKKNGTSGSTKIDIKRHVKANHPITFVNYQLSRNVQSIGRLGTNLATNSVTKRTPQINTQAINRAVGTESVESVIFIDSTQARYNFGGGVLLSADWKVGAKVKFASLINGGNNGEYTILEVNPDGHPGLIVDHGLSVTETGSAGNADLQYFEYVFINPIDVVGFKVGENAIFAGHTLAANDGNLEIVKINDGGNNLKVYNNAAGADTQAGIAGTTDSERFVYTFAAAALATDYIIGETLNAAVHVSANNDGLFNIVEINETGNNLVVINPIGVVQAGAGGLIFTNRWIYAVNTDPSPDILVGDTIVFSGSTNPLNDGTFELKEINRSALNNLIVFNENGVTQGGVAGSVKSELVVIGFDTDFSAAYVINRSQATIINFVNDVNNGFFPVIELNRGGGAAKNIVVKNIDAIEEVDPIGQVDLESRSLFDSNLPEIPTGEDVIFSGASAVFNIAAVEADAMVSLDVLSLPDGIPADLSVDLS